MGEKLRIQYRDFYDVPRIFLTTYKGRHFLLDCPFDDALDDYSAAYEVFLMRHLSETELKALGSTCGTRQFASWVTYR